MSTLTAPTPIKTGVSAVLRNRCVLVGFSGAYYHWLRRDTLASSELAKQKGISTQAYTTYKNIFLGADKLLTEIKDIVNGARAYHNQKTVPSGWRDYAVLPNLDIKDYRDTFLKRELELEGKTSLLSEQWPEMIGAAANALGPAFAKEAYPTIAQVLSMCWMEYEIHPFPSPDGFSLSDLDPTLAVELKANLQKEVTDTNQQAVAVLGDSLMTMLENARTNLSKVKGGDDRFRTEWHQNLGDFLPKVRAFLGDDNPAVAALVQRIENFLSSTPAEEYKKKPETRVEAKSELDSIIGEFGSMFGKESK